MKAIQLLFLIFAISQQILSMDIYPNDDFRFSHYSDESSDAGNSISSLLVEDSSLAFSYHLQPKYEYPYCGLTFYKENSALFDLSKKNDIILDISVDSATFITFYLVTKLDDTKIVTKYHQQTVHVNSGDTTLNLLLAEFNTPDWWYDENGVKDKKLFSTDYSQLESFIIGSGDYKSSPHKNSITVRSIAVSRKLPLIPFAITALFVLLIWAYQYAKRVKISEPTQSNEPNYTPLEVENSSDENLNRVLQCIGENFSDEDFSIDTVVEKTGVGKSKIQKYFRENVKMTFNKYLNTIRITEAKRLLSETDRNISEIAFTVGYGNISHFNRTFKQIEEVSPKEFRGMNLSKK